MFKEAKDLDQLVELHSRQTVRTKHYSRQLTMSLALLCLVFFGTIVTYHATSTAMNHITGMVVSVGMSSPVETLFMNIGAFTSFITTVKKSPEVTMYKLFFYTLWILAVLVGSLLYYEWKKR